jgi:Cys-tRNA(Pro)/Cys-tRNA(Cys) deacylase
MKKTNAMRLLDQAKVDYTLITFPYDQQAAIQDRVFSDPDFDLSSLYKTLVAKGDKTGICVAVIPIDQQLSYKKLAKLSGNKKMTMLPLKDLQQTTGYVRGGCSPIGMKKAFPTWIDLSAEHKSSITVNAGQRGALIQLVPQQLAAQLTPGLFVDICS